MSRLPKPGADNGSWGAILNDFLNVEHNPDGTLKTTGALATKANDSEVLHIAGNEVITGSKTFQTAPVMPAPTLGSHPATKTYVDAGLAAKQAAMAYDSAATYAQDSIVYYSGKWYVSLQNANTNNQPDTAMAWWRDAALSPSVFGTSFKNLFNPASAAAAPSTKNDGCVDGVVLNYPDGTQALFANNAIGSYVPVVPGLSYTISLPTSLSNYPGTIIYCFDTNKTYLGLDHAVSIYPVASGITATFKQSVNGRYCHVVTIAPGSSIRFIRFSLFENYQAHNTAFFDSMRNNMQVEIGSAPSTFVPYNVANGIVVLDSAMPTTYAAAQATIASLQSQMTAANATIASLQATSSSGGSTAVRVVRNNDLVYIRTAWSATHDLVQKMNMQAVTPDTLNSAVTFVDMGLVPIATTDANLAATAYTTSLKASGDDICPTNFNGTYIGANHGLHPVFNITVTGHNKTIADVGSEWTDSLGRKWYIIKIVNANTLQVMSQNTSVTDVWSFYSSISGTTLTHSAGAANTSAINFTTPTATQLYPALRHLTKTLTINGVTSGASNGVYAGAYAEVVHTYEIVNPALVLSYIIAGRPWATQPSFTHSSINAVCRVTITYRYNENGSCTVYQTVKNQVQISMGYLGYVQAANVTVPSGGALKQYVPKTLPFTISGRNYNLQSIQDITTLPDSLDLTSDRWTDANNPPERFVQYSTNSSSAKVFGFTLGYNQKVGIGQPSVRKTLISSAGFVHNSLKQYPRAVSSGSSAYPTNLIPAGKVFDCVSFRCPINYAAYPTATNVSWYYVNNDCYLMIDFHTAYNGYIALPANLLGKQIEVVESNGLTLNSQYVSQDGVDITVSGSHGSAVLRLY